MSRRPGDGGAGLRGRLAVARGRLTSGRGPWLLAAVLLAAAGAGLIVAVLRDGGTDRASVPERLRESVAAVVAPDGMLSESDRKLGIAYRRPRGWDRSRREGSLVLASPDRAVTLAISSPGERVDAAGLRRDAVATIRASYRNVEEVARTAGTFGTRRTRAVELAGTSSGGRRFRALVIAASGPDRTYVATLFSGRTPSVARLTEARLILRSIRFPAA